MRPRARTVLLCAALGLGAASCRHAPVKLQHLEVLSDRDANGDNATRVDLVFVYDTTLAGRLPETASDWFARRGTIVDQWRSVVDVVSLEIPPDHRVPAVHLPDRVCTAVAARAYADYLPAGGQHPLDLAGVIDVQLELRAADLKLVTRR